jgi:hypothetical protein
VGAAEDTVLGSDTYAFCYDVLTVGGYTFELCNEPVPPVLHFILRVSNITLRADRVYQARLTTTATIGSAGVNPKLAEAWSLPTSTSTSSMCASSPKLAPR